MYQYQVPEESPFDGPRLDVTAPIIVFDPWPFKEDKIALADVPHYWFKGGSTNDHLVYRDPLADPERFDHARSILVKTNFPFLGTATDGLMVLGSVRTLNHWMGAFR